MEFITTLRGQPGRNIEGVFVFWDKCEMPSGQECVSTMKICAHLAREKGFGIVGIRHKIHSEGKRTGQYDAPQIGRWRITAYFAKDKDDYLWEDTIHVHIYTDGNYRPGFQVEEVEWFDFPARGKDTKEPYTGGY